MTDSGETHTCQILAVESVTHDVRQFVVERPGGYGFEPGQATEVAVDDEKWRDKKRPFTFTGLPDNPNLEFTIKLYPSHADVTDHLGDLKPGDRLILHDVWGAITYRGPGVFIAGGAGVTPFIAILRMLEHRGELSGNRLLFSNKTADDIILHGDIVRMLGDDATFTLTQEEHPRFHHGRIDADFLKQHINDFDQPFYVCGPPEMVEELTETLKNLGASTDKVVIEE